MNRHRDNIYKILCPCCKDKVDDQYRLRQIRQSTGLTMREVAKQMNLSETIISKYENGSRNIPRDRLIEFCKLYGVSADYLLGVE